MFMRLLLGLWLFTWVLFINFVGELLSKDTLKGEFKTEFVFVGVFVGEYILIHGVRSFLLGWEHLLGLFGIFVIDPIFFLEDFLVFTVVFLHSTSLMLLIFFCRAILLHLKVGPKDVNGLSTSEETSLILPKYDNSSDFLFSSQLSNPCSVTCKLSVICIGVNLGLSDQLEEYSSLSTSDIPDNSFGICKKWFFVGMLSVLIGTRLIYNST